MAPEAACRLGAMGLPVHGRQSSVLFKEGNSGGYRLAITGGKHKAGDVVQVIPGLRMVLQYFVGGTNPDPGDPPREHLWFAVPEGHKSADDDETPAPGTSTYKKAQAAGLIPVRHRNRKKMLAA